MSITLVIISIILSVGIGLLIGVLSSNRKNREKDQRIIELQTQARGIENILNEVRQNLAGKDELIEKIRKEASTIEQAKTTAETKLQEAIKSVDEQKKLLERAEEKLTTASTTSSMTGKYRLCKQSRRVNYQRRSIGLRPGLYGGKKFNVN